MKSKILKESIKKRGNQANDSLNLFNSIILDKPKNPIKIAETCFKKDTWNDENRDIVDEYIESTSDEIINQAYDISLEELTTFIKTYAFREIDKHDMTQYVKSIRAIDNKYRLGRTDFSFSDKLENRSYNIYFNFDCFSQIKNPKSMISEMILTVKHELKHLSQEVNFKSGNLEFIDLQILKEKYNSKFLKDYYYFYYNNLISERQADNAAFDYASKSKLTRLYQLEKHSLLEQPFKHNTRFLDNFNDINYNQFLSYVFDTELSKYIFNNNVYFNSALELEYYRDGSKKSYNAVKESFMKADDFYYFEPARIFKFDEAKKQKLLNDLLENDIFYKTQEELHSLSFLKPTSFEYIELANQICSKLWLFGELIEENIYSLEQQLLNRELTETNKEYIERVCASLLKVQKRYVHQHSFYKKDDEAEIEYISKEHEVAKNGYALRCRGQYSTILEVISDKTIRGLVSNLTESRKLSSFLNIYSSKKVNALNRYFFEQYSSVNNKCESEDNGPSDMTARLIQNIDTYIDDDTYEEYKNSIISKIESDDSEFKNLSFDEALSQIDVIVDKESKKIKSEPTNFDKSVIYSHLYDKHKDTLLKCFEQDKQK